MKKTGFTLAEVLVTIGIIGVVSAMVIPTFTAQTQAAKIGPRLGKAVAEFEQATKAMLDDAQVNAISRASVAATGLCGTNTVLTDKGCFVEYLGHHMKGNAIFSNQLDVADMFVASNGMTYIFPITIYPRPSDDTTLAHKRLPAPNSPMNGITLDINGDSGPNVLSKDQFRFDLMDDGSLRPWGYSGEQNSANRWTTACPKNQKPSTTGAKYCAGHIMENGLKAEYKL